MAFDKVIDSAELDAKLTAVADAIRTKGGTTEALSFPDGYISAVEGIQAGGGDGVLASVLNKTVTDISNDDVITVGESIFRDCKNLVNVSFKNATSLGSYAFSGCSQLKTINTPKVTGVGERCFNSCASLESFTAPVEGLGAYVFTNCSNLTKVDVKRIGTLWAAVFSNCTSLKTIIVRDSSVTNFRYANALENTPFAAGGTGGTLYCKAELIEQYKQATNWSALYEAGTCNFVALEGSEYE